ncbi:lysozyme inhibitor LprI family protein [Paraburkholderia sp. EG287B]|uniref:lysozyme inhibitor LprI family protein n=1 Tax=Paraburkholderia sp. EG287B TaxID=3237010 RepID=UPI0034D2A864
MNREPKIRRAPFFKRGLNAAAIALFASLAGSPFAHAASFHCPHNASVSERLVCNDPTLSALDDKLAALYRSAFDASTDTTALEADRVSQWQWRQHNCKDKACVTDWYDRRIAELEGDLKHGKQAAVRRVKEGVVDQHLAPSAQDAVLEMHGIPPAPKEVGAAAAPSADSAKSEKKAGAKVAAAEADAPLHLQKMPSGVAADARQTRLAQAQAHAHSLPQKEAAPSGDVSAMTAKMAGANSAFAKAAGMASIDAPAAQPASSAATEAAAKPAADQASAQQGVSALNCASVASTESAHATQASIEQGAVAMK